MPPRCSALILVLAAASSALAVDPPQLLTYEGRLLRADGTPESGVVNFTFKLYESESDTTAVWTENQALGLSTNGYYSALLGSVNDLPNQIKLCNYTGITRHFTLVVSR